MQDNDETPVKTPRQKRAAFLGRHPRLIVALLAVISITLGGWALYETGVNKGKEEVAKSAEKTTTVAENSPLFTMPASGEVTEISEKEITIKIRGADTRKAVIDSKTLITQRSGAVKVSDISKGTKVVLFTKKVNNITTATRIVVQ